MSDECRHHVPYALGQDELFTKVCEEHEPQGLPTYIRIEIPPDKLTYVDGEAIDLTGILVKAYYEDDSLWGTVPFDELMFTPTTAISDVRTYEGHSYKIFPIALPPLEEEAYCVEQGGHLASITSQGEQDFLNEYKVELGYGNIPLGIGGSDLGSEGQWYWLDGEPFEYTNWNSGEPNNGQGRGQSYIQMYINGKWDDYYGGYDGYTDIKQAFICKFDHAFDNTITVSWARPEDAEILTDTFEITVN